MVIIIISIIMLIKIEIMMIQMIFFLLREELDLDLKLIHQICYHQRVSPDFFLLIWFFDNSY